MIDSTISRARMRDLTGLGRVLLGQPSVGRSRPARDDLVESII
jgi:hypothetical protein